MGPVDLDLEVGMEPSRRVYVRSPVVTISSNMYVIHCCILGDRKAESTGGRRGKGFGVRERLLC